MGDTVSRQDIGFDNPNVLNRAFRPFANEIDAGVDLRSESQEID